MNKRQTQESLDVWNDQVEHDRKQLALSLAIGGTGLGLAGVGIVGILSGAPIEGGVAIAVGGCLAATGGGSAKSEIEMMLKAKAVAAQRELQLEQAED